MNYFPPQGTKTVWPTTSRNGRRAVYKGWWMGVSESSKSFTAKIWIFIPGTFYFQTKTRQIEKHNFQTEKEAVDWCEHAVEMEVVKASLPIQKQGSGI